MYVCVCVCSVTQACSEVDTTRPLQRIQTTSGTTSTIVPARYKLYGLYNIMYILPKRPECSNQKYYYQVPLHEAIDLAVQILEYVCMYVCMYVRTSVTLRNVIVTSRIP